MPTLVVHLCREIILTGTFNRCSVFFFFSTTPIYIDTSRREPFLTDLRNWYSMLVQFSSVQFSKTVSKRSEKLIRAAPRLSKVSPMLLLKRFQCCWFLCVFSPFNLLGTTCGAFNQRKVYPYDNRSQYTVIAYIRSIWKHTSLAKLKTCNLNTRQ